MGEVQRLVNRDRERLGGGRSRAELGGSARPGGVDADHLAVGVGERATGVARLDRRVGLDEPGQLLGGAGPFVAGGDRPAQAGDPAGGDRGGAVAAERVADGDDLVADAHLRRVAEARGRQARGALQLQHRDVLGRAVADHLRRVGAAVADVPDLDRGGAVDHVVVGEHLAVRSQDDPGAGRLAALIAEVGDHVNQAGIGLGHDLIGGQHGARGRPRGQRPGRARADEHSGRRGQRQHPEAGPPRRVLRRTGCFRSFRAAGAVSGRAAGAVAAGAVSGRAAGAVAAGAVAAGPVSGRAAGAVAAGGVAAGAVVCGACRAVSGGAVSRGACRAVAGTAGGP